MGKLALSFTMLAILQAACTSATIKPRGEPLPVSAFPRAPEPAMHAPNPPRAVIVDHQALQPALPGPQAMPPASISETPAAQRPINTGSCDGSGCWSTSGERYHGGTSNVFIGPGGRTCHLLDGVLQCF